MLYSGFSCMYLKKLGIINHRSCQKVLLDLARDKPTTLIGINDSGKSTILKSIGLLLDPKPSFNICSETRFTSDVSNTPLPEEEYNDLFQSLRLPVFPYSPSSTLVIGELAIEENDLTTEFEGQASDAFKWAIENGQDGSVFLLRQYDSSSVTGRYFLCLGESSPPMELWTKKEKDIQAKRRELGLSDEEINNDNNKGRFANFEIMRAIYKKAGCSLSWAEATTFSKDDLSLLPTYRYIDWNTSLVDISNLANDVMKKKIAESRENLRKQAVELGRMATDEVNKELQELTKEFTKDLTNINGIKAQVNFRVEEQISDIIINKITADGDIRLESQGEGIKRQILFAFLKWARKKNVVEEAAGSKRLIWCFDEPESHLYPGAQRDLFSIITTLAKSDYQILAGTHSTIFVDRTGINDIYKVILNEKYSEVLRCKDISDIHSALGVQNSDILFYDKFLVVEGETEEVLVPFFYKLYSGRSLHEDCIQLIYLGGSGEYQRNKKTFEQVLRYFKKVEDTVQYIFDSDTKETGINVTLLGRCDLEDAISNKHWIKLIKQECALDLTDSDLDALRAQISDDADKKFHKLLCKEIASRGVAGRYLPGKRKCGEILKEIIMLKEDIPAPLVSVFSRLSS